MTDHLLQDRSTAPLHGEHRAVLLPNRWELRWIPNKHQTGFKGMGALQGNPQQGAVHHRGFIDQHQAKILESHSRLLGGLTEFDITRAFELQPQEAVDGGGIPGGLQPFEI